MKPVNKTLLTKILTPLASLRITVTLIVLTILLVFVGTTAVALPSRGFAAVNAALAVIALILAWRVGRHYDELTASKPAPAAAA